MQGFPICRHRRCITRSLAAGRAIEEVQAVCFVPAVLTPPASKVSGPLRWWPLSVAMALLQYRDAFEQRSDDERRPTDRRRGQ